MDWIVSALMFSYPRVGRKSPRSVTFSLVHFDNIEHPIIPGVILDEDEKRAILEPAEMELGSVLWLDAVELFMPYLCGELYSMGMKGDGCYRAICLGEGTGAVGCGLARTGLVSSEIIISDLPPLLGLMDLNAKRTSKTSKSPVRAISLDWKKFARIPELHPEIDHACNTIIACEVLYGNRFVWDDLLATILQCAADDCVVFICVTLRNARHDLEDFKEGYLAPHFKQVTEVELSDNVVVLVARRGGYVQEMVV